MKTIFRLYVALLALPVVFAACSKGGSNVTNPTYAVSYNGNGASGGSAPIDPRNYTQEQTATIMGNTGNLVKTGYSFTDWNTQANGTGTTYTQGETFTIGGSNVILYAQWTISGNTVTYIGNGATGGSVPIDTNHYSQGQTVTAIGNAGNLVYTGYSFAGWHTNTTGTGTTYAPGQTFSMSAANDTLYAIWSGGYAYVTNQMSQNISQYTIGPNGTLTPMSPATVAAGSEPISIAVDPTAKYAYAGNNQGGTVSQYTIGANGTLTPMNPAMVATGTGNPWPNSIAVNPSGKYAYVVNELSGNYGNVISFTIGTGGALSSPSGPYPVGNEMLTSIAVHPSGKYAYVTTLRNDYIVYQYTIGVNGALQPMTPDSVPAGSGPRQITIHPSGKYAYVACFDYGTISEYTIDPNTGELTPMGSITAGPQPFTITVDPSGKYAYVPNWNGNNVSEYTIDPNTGMLTPMPTATVATGTGPLTLAFDPSGKYAYVTNGGNNDISQYTIDVNGALITMPNTVPTGSNPWSIITVKE